MCEFWKAFWNSVCICKIIIIVLDVINQTNLIKHEDKVYVHPSAHSRRGKCEHLELVNWLGGLNLPRNSVVRLTDRPDMTIVVYRGRKTTKQQFMHPEGGAYCYRSARHILRPLHISSERFWILYLCRRIFHSFSPWFWILAASYLWPGEVHKILE